MPNLGRQSHVLIKREVTRNTPETTGGKSVYWQDFDSNIKNDDYMDSDSIGLLDETLFTDIQKSSVESKLKTLLDADLVIDFLHYFFGQSTPTTLLGATTWALSLLNNIQPPSFTLFSLKSDIGWKRTNGNQIKSLEIKASAGGEASFGVDMVGIDEVSAATQTPSYTKPTRYMLGRYVRIGYATNLAGLSAPTFFDCEEVTIKMNRKTEEDFALGQVTPVDILNGAMKIEVQFSAKVKTAIASFFDLAHKNGTKYALRVEIINLNAPVIGTSALKPTIAFNFPIGRFNVASKFPRDDFVKLDVDYIPEYSNADATTVNCTVINAVPSIT
jgi:Phage tail tube protein